MTSQIHTCVVCDMIRPELNGKLIILGFLGICPNVDIRLPVLDRPIPLTFLLTGQLNPGKVDIALNIADVQSQQVIGSTLSTPISVNGVGGSANIAPTMLLTFGHSGEFEVQCFVDGVLDYTGVFQVSGGDSPLSAD